jgi:ribulose-phosphate 3-epimerase
MTEITPAILPKSYEELETGISIATRHAPVVQIDICDGGYVPSRTWPYLKGPNVEDMIFNDIVAQEKALPGWEETDFEFDLMIKGAYEKIPDFISAGAARIIVHKGSVDAEEMANIIRDYGKHSEELGPFDVELGIALMPQDKAESIADIVDTIHFVQVMGVEKIGFQGQPASPHAVELIRNLRSVYPNLIISVDGGVNLESAPDFLNAGANRLVVGSALFGNEDFLGTLEEFRAL